MIEVPAVIFIAFLIMFAAIGFLGGRTVELTTREGRRERALRSVTPVWEVHVGSDGRDYGYGVYSSGEHVVVSVRKVCRSGRHFEQIQKIEVARVRGESDPEKILAAVDQANALVNTLALTGAA
jgi:hypothetical protein